MKNKKLIMIAAAYLLIILSTVSAVLVAGRSYTVYIASPFDTNRVVLEYEQQGIVEADDISFKKDYAVIKVKGLKPGKTVVNAMVYNALNENEYSCVRLDCTVLPTGVLYLSGYDFGGYQFVLLGMAAVTLFSFCIFFAQFRKRKKTQFFSYKTVLDLALMLFFGLQSIMYLGLLAVCTVMPERIDVWQLYNLAGFIMSAIFILSIPFIIIIAAFLSVSNLMLIIKEGFRISNLFGLLISAVLLAGSALCIVTILKNPNSTGVTLEEMRDALIRTVISSAFVYFECILLATQLCTQYAAQHMPKRNQDFILILGCKIRKDGTPLPLLKGRIDRAIEFYNMQLQETGKDAVFIPSGGKGRDEVISEAEAVKNYLVENGIDESKILPETSSGNTLENMKFSKRIADSKKENANILFVTTNYHVFRSGILSAKAGLRADGTGAKTKWYFWPNAQMREFVGLIASEWRINLIFIALMVLIPVLFSDISNIIDFLVK